MLWKKTMLRKNMNNVMEEYGQCYGRIRTMLGTEQTVLKTKRCKTDSKKWECQQRVTGRDLHQYTPGHNTQVYNSSNHGSQNGHSWWNGHSSKLFLTIFVCINTSKSLNKCWLQTCSKVKLLSSTQPNEVKHGFTHLYSECILIDI